MKKKNGEIALKYGCQSETGPIKSIILKHPRDALGNQEYVNANWKDLYYNGCPDYEKTIEEFDSLVELIAKETTDIYYLPKDERTGLDSVHTACWNCGRGRNHPGRTPMAQTIMEAHNEENILGDSGCVFDTYWLQPSRGNLRRM